MAVDEEEVSEDGHSSEDVEANVELLLAELEKKRLVDGECAKGDPFLYKVMGGKWLAEKKHLAYDAFRATWSGAEGKAFLARYGFHQSASFSVSKFGDGLARQCAEFLGREDDIHVP